MPVFLGWYQTGSVSEKIGWLNGKCDEWLRGPGARNLRDDVESNFQCPCTLDRARANPGFGELDPLCTNTFCKYNNFDNSVQCIESNTRR